jgi:hypothetical protein
MHGIADFKLCVITTFSIDNILYYYFSNWRIEKLLCVDM